MAKGQRREKHVPQRTCIACRGTRPKWEMVRLVRTPQGMVEIDPRGKRAGRGAYLCKAQACWEQGLKGNRLEHALKTKIDAEKRNSLLEYSAAFPAAEELSTS